MKAWFLSNKGPIGLFCGTFYLALLGDPVVREFMAQVPLLNSVISAMTFGLMAAGWLRSDREQKVKNIVDEMKKKDPE